MGERRQARRLAGVSFGRGREIQDEIVPPSPWPEGRLAKLPAPATAFGLDLRKTEVTDAGLKELTGLKSCKRLTFTAR